jgi:tetratricopeptide (TPR) repeat protein
LAYFNLHAPLYRQDNVRKASDVLVRAIEINPDDAQSHFYLGTIYDQQGDAESAEREFSHVRRIGDHHGHLLDGWAYVQSRRGPSTRFFADVFHTLEFAMSAAIVDGLVLEFGVRFGLSIRFIAAATDGDVHGFDSFQGLPEEWGNLPTGAYSAQGILPDVPPNVHLHVG